MEIIKINYRQLIELIVLIFKSIGVGFRSSRFLIVYNRDSTILELFKTILELF